MAELLDSTTARELNDWRLFDEVEPLGPRESRQQLATIAAILANAHRDPKTPAVKPADFLLQHAPADQTARNRKMLDMLRAVAKPVKRGKRKKRRGNR